MMCFLTILPFNFLNAILPRWHFSL